MCTYVLTRNNHINTHIHVYTYAHTPSHVQIYIYRHTNKIDHPHIANLPILIQLHNYLALPRFQTRVGNVPLDSTSEITSLHECTVKPERELSSRWKERKHVNVCTYNIDETLSMDAHTEYLWRILFCQLSRIGKICSFLSTDAANKLAVSLILSRLDYCNSPLAGIPDNKLNKLQCIQNHAAWLVLCKSRHASATILLRTLN